MTRAIFARAFSALARHTRSAVPSATRYSVRAAAHTDRHARARAHARTARRGAIRAQRPSSAVHTPAGVCLAGGGGGYIASMASSAMKLTLLSDALEVRLASYERLPRSAN